MSCVSTPPPKWAYLRLMNIPQKRKKAILLVLLQSPFFHSFEKMELVRLHPLLPGQQAGDHCVHVGLTKSTSFPRAVRKETGGKQERGGDGGPEKGLRQ